MVGAHVADTETSFSRSAVDGHLLRLVAASIGTILAVAIYRVTPSGLFIPHVYGGDSRINGAFASPL